MKRAHRFGIAAVAAAASVMLLAGCSVISDFISDDSPVRDPENAEITEGGDLDVFTIKLGDCFDDTAGTTVSELPVVPCADPHDNEVYFEIPMPEGDFPGDDAITTAATEGCLAQFEPFIGMAYESSALDYSYLTPTQGSWENNGDRLIQCIVYEPGAKVTGTLAGVAR